MKKEILLVAINAKYIHSNLAVHSIRGVLTENGHKAKVKEYTINNRVEDILDDIYTEKPVVIGFSCYIWNREYIEKLVASLGKLLPSCKIFLSGPEVSYNTDYYLDKYSNVSGVMVGEGEETFLELARYLFAEGTDEGCQNDIENLASLLTLAGCNYFMGIPHGDDIMLNYQTTGFRETATLRQITGKTAIPEFQTWLEKMGFLENGKPTRKMGDGSSLLF